jgi:hypothetical protein
MKTLLETTEWADGANINHVYFMDDSRSKMFAYVKFGQGEPVRFKNPIRIDIRGRKFKDVDNIWKFNLREEEPEGRTWEVKGSRGDVYRVLELNGNLSCTCSGFKFRGDCRHVKELSS